MDEIEVVVKCKTILGEGSLWDYRNNRLIWLDIVGKKLMFYKPCEGANIRVDLECMPGTVVPVEKGGLVGAFECGFCFLDEKTGKMTPIVDPEKNKPKTRFNDGKCDPSGRFWAGTMGRNGEKGMGTLYRLDPDKGITAVLPGVDISNGIIWSPDKRSMYYTDTLSKVIWSFDFNNIDGSLSNKKAAVIVEEQDGFPDGMTIDSEGRIWAAHWGGGKVACYEPWNGKKVHEIRLPVSQVSSCAFGGKNLDTLFITTAGMELDKEALEEQPLSGALFACKPGVKGIKAGFYAG